MSEQKTPQWMNTFRVSRGYEAFYVELGLVLTDKEIPVFEFLMHPKSAKGLMKALNKMIKEHEKEYGEIPETELEPIEKKRIVGKKKLKLQTWREASRLEHFIYGKTALMHMDTRVGI